MKKIVSIVGGLIAVVVFVFVFAGDAIKVAVEEMGPKLTKSEVKLAKVDLSLASGEAALSGLKIGNPATFSTPHAFKLDNIAVKIDTSSIGQDTIVIKEILINAPNIIAEFKDFPFSITDAKGSIQKELKTSNFIAIQNNVDEFVKQSGGGKSSGGDAAPAKEGDEPKLIIEKFSMTGDLIKSASEIFKNMGGAVKDAVGGATKALEGVTKNLGGATGGAGEAVGDAAKGATDGLKKLFGK